jgi:hypothetical protein
LTGPFSAIGWAEPAMPNIGMPDAYGVGLHFVHPNLYGSWGVVLLGGSKKPRGTIAA